MAQRLQGAYFTTSKDIGWESDLFQFKGQQFFHKHFSCTNTNEGRGNFTVTADSLILRFEEPAAPLAITTMPCNDKAQSTAFCLKVIDQEKHGIPGVTIRSVKQPTIGVSTDTAGIATLAYRLAQDDSLVVTTVGFLPIYIPLKIHSGQGFTVTLGNVYYVSAGTLLVFPIRKLKSNAFSIKRYPTSNKRFHYQRISDVRALELINSR